MASSKEYLNYILEQLEDLEGITHRMMMGEYIIYYNGRIAAYICDDRLLIKPVETAKKMLEGATYEPPYKVAKDMILMENTDDKDFLQELFNEIYEELPIPKPKKAKA